jgi:hypothetical protein
MEMDCMIPWPVHCRLKRLRLAGVTLNRSESLPLGEGSYFYSSLRTLVSFSSLQCGHTATAK